MVKQPTAKDLDSGVRYADLRIGAEMEDDRFELDSRGPMQITRYRVDTRTQYYDRETGQGGILKFDGFDVASGAPIKYRTTSRVILSNFVVIAEKVGVSEQEDEKENKWFIFLKPVNIGGFEKVKSSIKGRNPYIKILP